MKVLMEVPNHIINHLETIIHNRRVERSANPYLEVPLPGGGVQRMAIHNPPMSRSSLLIQVLELGFEQFQARYSTPATWDLLFPRGYRGEQR